MRILILVSFIFCCALCGCEDKKKTSEEKAETTKEVKKDSAVAKDVSEENKKEIESAYPKITDENVVEFLTQYGKDNPETKVRITTQHGAIEMQLFEDTPLHRANFIYLIKQRYFENTFFHRIAPGFIIQGGNSDLPSTPKKRAQLGKDYRLPAEITSKSVHRYGSLCGAKEYRKNPDKKSEPFEFYIFIGEPRQANHLNGDYTIFGKVTKGMNIVEKIANLPADEGEWPKQNVYLSAEVLH
ncbi:MAG: peptidylprolyl isomerase [Bacteroidota bacterium]